MEQYESLITEIIHREGGYVDHNSDRGGPTRFGITERVARNYGFSGSIRDLPESTARNIYAQRYWFEPNLNLVFDMAPSIGVELLDTGVNQGVETAGRFLQKALNAFNKRGQSYPDVVTDGVVGRKTLDALKSFIDQRGQNGVRVLLAALNCQQGALYLKLAADDVTQEDFVYGWILNRVAV